MDDKQWQASELIANNVKMQEVLTLVKYGIDFNFAMQMPDEYRFAFIVFYKTTYENFEFNWSDRLWSLRIDQK